MDPKTILTVASTALQALGAISQGAAAKSAASYNAQLAEREAATARDTAAYEEQKSRDQARKVLGAQRSAFSKAGVTLEGTPLEVLAETAAEAEADALMIRRAGSIAEARSLAEAAQQRMAGRAAMTKGIMSAGGRLLGGGAKALTKGDTKMPDDRDISPFEAY